MLSWTIKSLTRWQCWEEHVLGTGFFLFVPTFKRHLVIWQVIFSFPGLSSRIDYYETHDLIPPSLYHAKRQIIRIRISYDNNKVHSAIIYAIQSWYDFAGNCAYCVRLNAFRGNRTKYVFATSLLFGLTKNSAPHEYKTYFHLLIWWFTTRISRYQYITSRHH